MSFFTKLFGHTPPKRTVEELQAGADALNNLAKALANNANVYPHPEDIRDLLRDSGYASLPLERVRFALSIANAVLNIWLLNQRMSRAPRITNDMVELTHRLFFALQDREKKIRIADFIVAEDELATLRVEFEATTPAGDTDPRNVNTNWWSLMDMVYLSRQKIYVDALESASRIKLAKGFGPTSILAMRVTSHVTGVTRAAGGDHFSRLMAGLDVFLERYADRTRKMIPTGQ